MGEDDAVAPVAIIGAGMAGIACAARLRNAGINAVIVEKSRGLGGRLATRRSDTAPDFDHGAPAFAVSGTAFRDFVQSGDPGSAGDWPGPNETHPNGNKQAPEFVGIPAMNSFLKRHAAAISIQFHTRVEEVLPHGAFWRLHFDNDEQLDARIVVSTAPAPQTINIGRWSPEITDAARAVDMTPCWTVMAATADNNASTPVRLYTNDPVLDQIIMNNAKPGRSSSEAAFVLHATPDWSKAHLDDEPGDVITALLAAAKPHLGTPDWTHVKAHRWLYARVKTDASAPFLCNEANSFFAAGDWCAGGEVEGAFQSGLAAADAIIRAVNR